MREVADASGVRTVAAGGDQRFFIVTAARTGSTLLSAILADAGADFGMPTPQGWDRAGGDLEHPDLWRALRYFRSAEAISTGRPPVGVARMRWNAYRSLGKKWLCAGLGAARFAKVYGAHDLVRPAFKIGYFPSVILSYRRFEDQALSLGLMHAHATLDSLRDNYRHVYCDGLWLLNTFGGCVVGYESLTDRGDRKWAEPLARVTGLPIERLVTARDRRIDASSSPAEAFSVDRTTDRLFEAMEALSGRTIPPSEQALRLWSAVRARDQHRVGAGHLARWFELPRIVGDA